jgi:hypothetical protein
MNTIKIKIEKHKDFFSAYAQNIVGVYGNGNTVQEAKRSVLKSIRLLKKYNTHESMPKILKGEYEIIYERI